MSLYPPAHRVTPGWRRNGRSTSLLTSTQRFHHEQRPQRDFSLDAFARTDAAERRRRRAQLELLLRTAKGFGKRCREMRLESGENLLLQ